jgi:hypothetical protein
VFSATGTNCGRRKKVFQGTTAAKKQKVDEELSEIRYEFHYRGAILKNHIFKLHRIRIYAESTCRYVL